MHCPSTGAAQGTSLHGTRLSPTSSPAHSTQHPACITPLQDGKPSRTHGAFLRLWEDPREGGHVLQAATWSEGLTPEEALEARGWVSASEALSRPEWAAPSAGDPPGVLSGLEEGDDCRWEAKGYLYAEPECGGAQRWGWGRQQCPTEPLAPNSKDLTLPRYRMLLLPAAGAFPAITATVSWPLDLTQPKCPILTEQPFLCKTNVHIFTT